MRALNTRTKWGYRAGNWWRGVYGYRRQTIEYTSCDTGSVRPGSARIKLSLILTNLAEAPFAVQPVSLLIELMGSFGQRASCLRYLRASVFARDLYDRRYECR